MDDVDSEVLYVIKSKPGVDRHTLYVDVQRDHIEIAKSIHSLLSLAKIKICADRYWLYQTHHAEIERILTTDYGVKPVTLVRPKAEFKPKYPDKPRRAHYAADKHADAYSVLSTFGGNN